LECRAIAVGGDLGGIIGKRVTYKDLTAARVENPI
jgi:hypothetical protein